jgi:membrane-associated protease RseP (regulator of RpoE activity)
MCVPCSRQFVDCTAAKAAQSCRQSMKTYSLRPVMQVVLTDRGRLRRSFDSGHGHGLDDRDDIRELLARPRRQTLFSRRNLSAIFVVVAVIGFLAFQLLPRDMFRNNWIAVARIHDMEQVGWAGNGFDGVHPAQQAALGVPFAVKVTGVAPDAPAHQAGLMVDDYIVGLNGKPFADVLEFQGSTRDFRPGQTITLNVVRASKLLAVSISLTTWAEIKELENGGVGF